MERKQGFFSALKDEVVRGLSPATSHARSPARTGSPMSRMLRRKKNVTNPEPLIERYGSLRPVGETLTPLIEGPIQMEAKSGTRSGNWMKRHLSRTPSMTLANAYRQRSHLRLLLGVMDPFWLEVVQILCTAGLFVYREKR